VPDAASRVARAGHAQGFARREPAERELRANVGTPALEPTPATLAGRLVLDGRPPPHGGRVRYRSDDGARDGMAPLDPEGRFWLADVPPAGLVLSFELPASGPRVLLLPGAKVRGAEGRPREIYLDWKTKHVNLEVIGDAAEWNESRVRVTGDGYDAIVPTDEGGELALTLVGAGLVTFRAVLCSGCQGEATLELPEDGGLDSVLIRATDPSGR
jgi:hypothetical protein